MKTVKNNQECWRGPISTVWYDYFKQWKRWRTPSQIEQNRRWLNNRLNSDEQFKEQLKAKKRQWWNDNRGKDCENN